MPTKSTQPPRDNKNAAASPNLPVKTFRLGRIKAAVWENEGEQKFYSVTFARTYMDEANKYHDSDSFGRESRRFTQGSLKRSYWIRSKALGELCIRRRGDRPPLL
jgi:hypothetical protein